MVFNRDSTSTVQGSASLQFRAGFKQISQIKYCAGISQVSEMFRWGSAPPERLKTTGLETVYETTRPSGKEVTELLKSMQWRRGKHPCEKLSSEMSKRHGEVFCQTVLNIRIIFLLTDVCFVQFFTDITKITTKLQ